MEIIELLKKGEIKNKDELQNIKISLSRKYKCPVIRSSVVYAMLNEADKKQYNYLLQIKPSRTESGVTPVAIMTSPYACPHGKCIYCPGGVENHTAQSYTGEEPAALRARQNSYDPFLQTKSRLETLIATGHPVDKIDLIIMGGTFTARDRSYQQDFIKRAFDAVNGYDAVTLEEAIAINETAERRVIGITVETRPDWFMKEHRDLALSYGATRVELGVQCIEDSVLKATHRAHTVNDIAMATSGAREDGFKIVYHLMPGLPGMNPERDLEGAKKIFSDERFKPDMLKIYPTLVIKNTVLYDLWRHGAYTPYDTEVSAELIARIMEIIPPYVRIQRIQRDIPARLIVDGVKQSNLHEIAIKKLEEKGMKCRCIRCREVARNVVSDRSLQMKRFIYNASSGTEYFLSIENNEEHIFGYLRLRLNSNAKTSIIRELKVLGAEVLLNRTPYMDREVQHRGLGKWLIEEAERITIDNRIDMIHVLSGVGVREYFRKIGYFKKEPYMARKLV
ncbi:MAG: tRNA uridine(34) 5-carboxymethylaminomethyl modification radical SAM/GNAT enzyme Elp3 [Candidatus Thermoplasmatota archaeon]|jgi:elongator complex protein 3|nr:tRNA uridine(34) 5-carboxymethylaminomethyl modification radical SAM/GNAT enzyme Elp3 [Candidatus Thermoplasmatota archaeon]MCL5963789.1 tRNA uridine(34) 5-carboxymethylaminomethyl modification radical SAM/GNAT enzyme Elp3 [Candidatus Thermoplasmatota archaeon]